jgi:hypothetical protein
MTVQRYNFLPIYWIPQARNISTISSDRNAVVTTQVSNGYLNGLYIRLFLPSPISAWRTQKGIFQIEVLSDTTFSIALDTTGYGPLTLYPNQIAQVIPVGEFPTFLDSTLFTTGYLVPQ